MSSSNPAAATPMLIVGAFVGAASGRAFAVMNPADDTVVGAAPDGGATETRQAIEAAAAALPAWRDTPAPRRGELLRAFAALIQRDTEPLARLMTLEQGKPLAEARGEINYARTFVEWAAGEAPRIYGETIPASVPNKRLLVLRQPVGVCAAITPWNFPAAMITRKLGPALAAGCTMVLKPAEETPLTALALGRLATEAGLPPGVVNIVTGDAKAIAGDPLEPARAQAELHGLHRGRGAAHAAGGGEPRAPLARAGRARAVHRLRRRRPRRRGDRRRREQVPQRGPDLRLRQPHLRAGARLRPLRGVRARRSRRHASGPDSTKACTSDR
ncbi:MAG: aldehyde dehydrogenase family protein [Phycisphaerales bacterium]